MIDDTDPTTETYCIELNNDQVQILGKIGLAKNQKISTYEDLQPILQKLVDDVFDSIHIVLTLKSLKPNM